MDAQHSLIGRYCTLDGDPAIITDGPDCAVISPLNPINRPIACSWAAVVDVMTYHGGRFADLY